MKGKTIHQKNEMKFQSAVLVVASSLASVSAFAPATFAPRSTSSLNIVIGDDTDLSQKVQNIFAKGPAVDNEFEEVVQEHFPGAVNNKELVSKVVEYLSGKGYKGDNTLLATSLWVAHATTPGF